MRRRRSVTEVKFNYSEDPEAKTLLDWFERIAETERALIELERPCRFDKLGVQDAILRIEIHPRSEAAGGRTSSSFRCSIVW